MSQCLIPPFVYQKHTFMGKKRRKQQLLNKLNRPWCFYCDRDFDDEKVLIQHQRAKHFKCSRCSRRLGSAPGMGIHMLQVHKENLTSVPNAIEGRDTLAFEIVGMSGIPERFHKERQAQLEREIMGDYPASKKQRLEQEEGEQQQQEEEEEDEQNIHRATPPAVSAPVRPVSSSSPPTSVSPATVASAPTKAKGTGTIVSAMPVLYSQQQQQQTAQTSSAPTMPFVPPSAWAPPVTPYVTPAVPPPGMPPTYMPYPPYGFPQAYGAGVSPPYFYGKPPIAPYAPPMYMSPGSVATPYGIQALVPPPPAPTSSSSTTNGASSTVAAIKQDMQSPVQFVDYNNQFTAKRTEIVEKQDAASTESAEASVREKEEAELKEDRNEKSESKQTILIYNDEEVSMEEKRFQLEKYNKT